MTDEVREILTAPEIVAVAQDPGGRQGRRVRRDGDIDVWVRSLRTSGRWAIGVLNRGPDAREVRIALEEIGMDPRADVRVRDLWQRADVGKTRREIVTATTANSATVLGISAE